MVTTGRPAIRCIKNLETALVSVDQEFDQCNEVWAKGETEGFYTEKFLVWIQFFQCGESISTHSNINYKHVCKQPDFRFYDLAEKRMKEGTGVFLP